MELYIKNETSFYNAIYNYIIETYSIEPKIINTDSKTKLNFIIYNVVTSKVSNFDLHDTNYENIEVYKEFKLDKDCIVFHALPELYSYNYITMSIYDIKIKRELIRTMKHWLPIITSHCIDVVFNNNVVTSDLEPSYALQFFKCDTKFSHLTYRFLQSNIVTFDESSISYESEYSIAYNNKIINITTINYNG